MIRGWFITFMVVAIGIFMSQGARADSGDFYMNKLQTLAETFGHTAATMLNPEGRGDALIFPYYDVREIDGKAQDFYFIIINDDGGCESPSVECHMGMAAKVRFKEWDKGEEVFDIDVWLSRGDVWVGVLTHNTSFALPYGARITSPDWVIIHSTSDTFTLSKPLQGGFDLPNTAYIPAGSNNLMGYFEVIGEERTFDHQVSGAVTRFTGNSDAPNSLMGYAYIVRAADGISFAYNAKAIANFSRNQGSLFQNPGGIKPTLMDCEDTLDELEFQIAKEEVIASYSIEDVLAGKMSLILTFPTKWAHFSGKPNYTIKGPGAFGGVYPLGVPWTAPNANSPETIEATIFDRNENRVIPASCSVPPCPGPLGLPFEVNVIGLYSGTPPTVPAAGNRDNVALSTTTFNSGYVRIHFPNTGYVQVTNPKITRFLDFGTSSDTYGGLPVLGLSLQQYSNGNVGGFYGDMRDVFYEITRASY
jgi:hypothetical protein